MEPFNLKNAVKNWKKELWKEQGLEPGFIEEIESNLLDRIDDYLSEGHSEERAFLLATEKSIENPEDVANEYFIAGTGSNSKPPWRSTSLFSTMPINLKIAARSLIKRKIYTVINSLGLAISIAVSFLIWLYVSDQFSYDLHLGGSDRVYRINYDLNLDGQQTVYSNVAQPIGPALKEEFSEIEEVVRFYGRGRDHAADFIVDEVTIKSNKVFYAEEAFLRVFKIPLISGNADQALKQPNSIVISESVVKKLFSSTNVIGKTLQIGQDPSSTLKITGIIQDHVRTHLPVEALISTSIPDRTDEHRWLGGHVYTYALLNEFNDIEGLREKIPAFCGKYINSFFEKKGGKANLLLQPLRSIYLDEEHVWELFPHGNRTNVLIVAVMMVFLIIIAGINYVNLATATSAERAREVGIRKALGSSKRSLIRQFLIESVLLALCSGVVAVFLCLMILPLFNELSGLQVSINTIIKWPNLLGILLLSLMIGLLSGVYPAFYLISFQPVNILKGRFVKGRGADRFRTVLVISQYCLTSILVVGMLFVDQQTRFMMTKKIGYNKSDMISLKIPRDLVMSDKVDTFINAARNQSSVLGITGSYNALTAEPNANDPVFETPDGQIVSTAMDRIDVDFDFIKTIGAEIITGRDFDRTRGERERHSILINEAAVKKYGWDNIATDLKLRSKDVDEQGKYYFQEVIGVVGNFSIGPSHQKVTPLMINLNEWGVNNIYVRINDKEAFNAIAQIESAWHEAFVNYHFDFTFLEQELNGIYSREARFLNLLKAVSFLIIFITSLGIIGLISFTLEMRQKEIAIRKISGASIQAILALLSRKFMGLIIIANCIATPISFYLVKGWLISYEQHINLSVLPFLWSVAICLVFTSLALAYHSLRAAKANPVESLRYE